MTPLVDGGTRAPGCVVKGCPEQVERGALICTLHSRILAALPREVPRATFSHAERKNHAPTD